MLKDRHCERCRDKNFLIECACGCGRIRRKYDTAGRERRFIHAHNNNGENHNMWKGGRYKTFHGYWIILKRDHPFCNKDGYIQEHRLVMEEHLGRYLTKEEVVHHINGNTEDNRIENLQLFANNEQHLIFENTGKKRTEEDKQKLRLHHNPKSNLNLNYNRFRHYKPRHS